MTVEPTDRKTDLGTDARADLRAGFGTDPGTGLEADFRAMGAGFGAGVTDAVPAAGESPAQTFTEAYDPLPAREFGVPAPFPRARFDLVREQV
ncbi:hypothetical protein GFH48_07840 [Streptomyces fagopyri]|uniref:Uncharacterized protein n=1 Tax=Streptomyces fagopyri TaxID=2662397 RepID=A0A5Q0L8P6_9ACTN|nr:hypothetical protein [Streptomyces fagopyri]QFZ73184.1 hypothetical protein GFH48_07840 [Streptomyces fagopyri]